MLEFHLHLDKMKRKHPFPIPLVGLGYSTNYPVFQTTIHDRLYFSFILKGTGNLRIDGREYILKAPCVFFQYPGILMHHSSNGNWDELFAGYAPESIPSLKKMNFLQRGKPVWQIENYNEFMSAFNRVVDLVRRINEHGVPDLLDCLLQELILLSFQKGESQNRNEKDRRVGQIIAYIDTHCSEPLDFMELVALHGLSYSSFLRRWRSIFNISPQKYWLQVRMKKASSLLMDTELRINEIAEALGYDNPFYFSKVFHDFFGITASKYRKKMKPFQK